MCPKTRQAWRRLLACLQARQPYHDPALVPSSPLPTEMMSSPTSPLLLHTSLPHPTPSSPIQPLTPACRSFTSGMAKGPYQLASANEQLDAHASARAFTKDEALDRCARGALGPRADGRALQLCCPQCVGGRLQAHPQPDGGLPGSSSGSLS